MNYILINVLYYLLNKHIHKSKTTKLNRNKCAFFIFCFVLSFFFLIIVFTFCRVKTNELHTIIKN